jgi:hypothetical protein
LLGTVLLLLGIMKKRRSKPVRPQETRQSMISIEEMLSAAQADLSADDKAFYRSINHALWNYFQLRFGITGSQANKNELGRILAKHGLTKDLSDEFIALLGDCEKNIYTSAELNTDRVAMFERSRNLLEEAERSFSA